MTEQQYSRVWLGFTWRPGEQNVQIHYLSLGGWSDALLKQTVRGYFERRFQAEVLNLSESMDVIRLPRTLPSYDRILAELRRLALMVSRIGGRTSNTMDISYSIGLDVGERLFGVHYRWWWPF